MEVNNEKVIDMVTEKTKEERFKEKFEMVKDIAITSASAQLQDVRTYQFAAGLALWQGLKYRGSIRQGFKAGVAGMAVITGCNVVVNIVRNIDEIKNV